MASPARLLPPATEKPVQVDGWFAPTWVGFFQKLADQTAVDLTGVTGGVAGAAAAAAAAQTTANTANATANAVKTRMDVYDATQPNWTVGDIRESAFNSFGPAWLPCDGTPRNIADYPALAALLELASGPAFTTLGRFALPDIASRNGPSGQIALRSFIRAG